MYNESVRSRDETGQLSRNVKGDRAERVTCVLCSSGFWL